MATNRASVKRRHVSVYLPPNGKADRWKRLAEKAGLSLSQYVQNTVEDHIKKFEELIDSNDLDEQIDRIKEMSNRIGRQQSDMKKQQSDMKKQQSDMKKQQSDMKKQHSRLEDKALDVEEWLRHIEDMMQIIKKESKDPFFREIKKYKSKIITLLKERKVVKEQELLDLLCVDHSDTESVKIVNQQLDNLFVFNLVKRCNGEITWVK